MQMWTKHEIEFLRESLDLSTKELYLKFCDEYGGSARSYDSVQKKIKALREAFAEDEDTSTPAAPSEIESMLGISQGAQELVVPDITAEKRRQLKDEARWWLEGIMEESEGITFHPDAIVEGNGKSLCVLVSDSHIGKHNENFDIETAEARFRTFPEMIQQMETGLEVDEVVLMLMGDIVEGADIFPTQAHHTECPTITQVQIATEAIWRMMLQFRSIYNCPVRVETVPGNHGRMSRTAHEKTNWDNVVYHIVSVMAEKYGDENIIVNRNFDWFKTFKVKDKVGMLYHYGVKHTGTPAMREKVAGWASRKNFDFMCHGHWHEWHVGNWLSKVVISNGCLCGPDDLAEKMAKEDVARQGYFLVTPGQPIHGISFVEWP